MDEHADVLRRAAQAVLEEERKDSGGLGHAAALDWFDAHATPDAVSALLDRMEGLQAALRDANAHIDELQGRLSDTLDENGRLSLNRDALSKEART